MNNYYFGVIYINTDEPEHSEIYGIYKNYDKAINELLKCANYRENNEGELTQYMRKTNEYKNLEEIKNIIRKNNELIDVDIYRIEKLYIS